MAGPFVSSCPDRVSPPARDRERFRRRCRHGNAPRIVGLRLFSGPLFRQEFLCGICLCGPVTPSPMPSVCMDIPVIIKRPWVSCLSTTRVGEAQSDFFLSTILYFSFLNKTV